MNGLLIRVGADLSAGGGNWNGPVDCSSNEFAYIAIPETAPIHPGHSKPYQELAPVLSRFEMSLPLHLRRRDMHLDPDFEQLSYGDQGERAKQLRDNLGPSDLVVFYAGLREVRTRRPLTYGLIGIFVVDELLPAAEVPISERHINAHTRRVLRPDANDLIVRARPGVSGRLQRCIPIGEYRDRAYRVRREVLEAWGGLSVKDGYLQRSARLPRFLDPSKFMRWFEQQGASLVQTNN